MSINLSDENNKIAKKLFDQIKSVLYESEDMKKLNKGDFMDVTRLILKNIVGHYIYAISEKNILYSFGNLEGFKEDVEDHLMEIELSNV